MRPNGPLRANPVQRLLRQGFFAAWLLAPRRICKIGRWGSVLRRDRWDCEAFTAESEALVQEVAADRVRFGYSGQRTADIAEGIRISDVEWLLAALGRLNDAQIAAAVAASGGTADEVACFTGALRVRLDRLSDAVATSRTSLASN